MILVTSLKQCFHICGWPTYSPTTFQIQMYVPWSLFLFSSASSPLLHLLNATLLLYLWLTQFPGLIHAPCRNRLCSSRLTDRQINTLAWRYLLCPLLCPPTPLGECQTQHYFFVFNGSRGKHTYTLLILQNHLLVWKEHVQASSIVLLSHWSRVGC